MVTAFAFDQHAVVAADGLAVERQARTAQAIGLIVAPTHPVGAQLHLATPQAPLLRCIGRPLQVGPVGAPVLGGVAGQRLQTGLHNHAGARAVRQLPGSIAHQCGPAARTDGVVQLEGQRAIGQREGDFVESG